jgi:hypothetical protein
MSMFPVIALLTELPPIDTVPRHTGVGRRVEKVGEVAVSVLDAHPVVFASYSNIPSALKRREKSENWHPGYERLLAA